MKVNFLAGPACSPGKLFPRKNRRGLRLCGKRGGEISDKKCVLCNQVYFRDGTLMFAHIVPGRTERWTHSLLSGATLGLRMVLFILDALLPVSRHCFAVCAGYDECQTICGELEAALVKPTELEGI